ncbi:hypothetical protein VARIO8X_50594 [Burkholderiales bacterium 8X]|nr:hypothetical protein VARIO8X_50594 [Burkholderiales bacterium 8X]
MTVFTIDDKIFGAIKSFPGVAANAVQNLVIALNSNRSANETLSLAVTRGDLVIELANSDLLSQNNASALYSNDRGTRNFIERGNKFAIQLDPAWFVEQKTAEGTAPAAFTKLQTALTSIGFIAHEADHSNNQALYDEAYQLRTKTPAELRPDLTGAARSAASLDLVMKAEVLGWYAELSAIRSAAAADHISQGQYQARTADSFYAGLIKVESQGKALGLTGSALIDYIGTNGRPVISGMYVDRYIDAYLQAGTDKNEVRGILTYVLNDPNQVKGFSEDLGPEGTYISSAVYNNGDRVTTIYGEGHTRTKETLQPDGTYRTTETHSVTAYNPDGSFRDQTITRHDASGSQTRTEVDGASDNSDYSSRTTTIDYQGRVDWSYDTLDDGSTTWKDYDQTGSRGDSIWMSHTDAQGRSDWVHVTQDDRSINWIDYDQQNLYGAARWESRTDAQGRLDTVDTVMDDGSRYNTNYDETGSQAWSRIESTYDAYGRADTSTELLDDGQTTWTDYDQSGVRGDRAWITHADAAGRTDWVHVTQDDGSVNWTDYDQLGANGANRWESRSDPQGRVDWINVVLDDGSRDWIDYNETGASGWTRVESHFDWAGREDSANLYTTDGGRLAYDYDQEGSHGWRRVETKFDAAGNQDFTTRYFDDGSRFYVDNDFYGFGKHKLLGFNALGQGIYHGEQIRGAVVSVAGSFNPAWGEGMNVQAVIPTSAGPQPKWSPTPQHFPEYDPYPNAHAEVGPIEYFGPL